jgi:heme/copper-type cytochrome/quinol oxidase subunit 3
MKTTLNTFSSKFHKFHIVTPSPWPFVTSIGSLLSALGAVLYMQYFENGLYFLLMGLILVIVALSFWWRDVIREATYEGKHTYVVQRGLKMGFALFIASEVMFFLAFFWAFFHSSLSPGIEIGSVWPPEGLVVFKANGVPLLNTYILLLSGVTITYAHHYMIEEVLTNKLEIIEGFLLTIFLAVYFTTFQVYEYLNAPFSISDGIYGSVFFMATGFHGFHVIIGTLFITICFFRFLRGHFTSSHHVGFEAAAWYWHFVDVVWLFLFVTIYWWGTLEDVEVVYNFY